MPATAKKDKETAIFWAACRVIREKGFHQARMADIAKEAGISYGLVYHYFKNKSDLFDALIKEWWRGLDEVTDKLSAEEMSIEDKLGAVVEYFLDQYIERPELVHLFITELSRSTTNLTPKRLKPFKGLMKRIEEIIKEGQRQGTLRTDLKSRYLMFFFLGSVEALLSTMVLEDQPLKSQKHKRRLADAVLTMFLDGARTKNG
ncbi:MAG: TetR/AcrR family transcriptional regulator [Deltaproteobacteria bacterium]|nr:TetR/AcrR family transcriptional regulator [Deltaproteobacteria bacterium]